MRRWESLFRNIRNLSMRNRDYVLQEPSKKSLQDNATTLVRIPGESFLWNSVLKAFRKEYEGEFLSNPCQNDSGRCLRPTSGLISLKKASGKKLRFTSGLACNCIATSR